MPKQNIHIWNIEIWTYSSLEQRCFEIVLDSVSFWSLTDKRHEGTAETVNTNTDNTQPGELLDVKNKKTLVRNLKEYKNKFQVSDQSNMYVGIKGYLI